MPVPADHWGFLYPVLHQKSMLFSQTST